MTDPLPNLYPTITLSYPRFRRFLLCLLAYFTVSLLSFASASELKADSTAELNNPEFSESQLQTFITAAEEPAKLWQAVGDNEFAVYETDTSELIAYVAQHDSRQVAFSPVDHILTSSLSAAQSSLSSGSVSNREFATLLTENFTEFDEPLAAIAQLQRFSALPDNPEQSFALALKASGVATSNSRSVAVPSPSSLWLLLFAPMLVLRQRQSAA